VNRARAVAVRVSMRALATLVMLAVSLPAQQHGAAHAIEDVGEARVPSRALFKRVKAGAEDVLWFDVGYAVRRVVVEMHEDWGWIESKRSDALIELLDAMRVRLKDEGDESRVSRRLAGIVDVAGALLYGTEAIDGEAGGELREVRAVGDGRMRFVPGAVECSWRSTRPRGGYAADSPRFKEFEGLFRATEYLRLYLAKMPDAQRQRFVEVVDACRQAGAGDALAMVDEAMALLFGAAAVVPGVPQPAVSLDLLWLRRRAQQPGPSHEVLPELFGAVKAEQPRSMADGVLRLCHLLANAEANDAVFGELTKQQWRAKWRDAASFAYVGLREVDCASRAVGIESFPKIPRVVIEPLPEVWRALRWLDLKSDELTKITHPHLGGGEPRSWIDEVLAALEVQQRGERLSDEQNLELVELLVYAFGEPDMLLGTVSELDGVQAALRRAEPRFVRLPIRWRGEVHRVLALRLYVQQQGDGGDGDWRDPPWGVTLDVSPAAGR